MGRQCMGFFYFAWQAIKRGKYFLLLFCPALVFAETVIEIRLLLWTPQVFVMRGKQKILLFSKEAISLQVGDRINTGENGYAVIGYILREKAQARYFSQVLKAKETCQIEANFAQFSQKSIAKSVSQAKYGEWEDYSRQYRFISFAGVEPGIEMRNNKWQSLYCLSPQGAIAQRKPIFYAVVPLGQHCFSLELVDILEGKSLSLVFAKEERGQIWEEKISIHSFVLPEGKMLEYDRSYLVHFYARQNDPKSSMFSCRFSTLPQPLAEELLQEKEVFLSKAQKPKELIEYYKKWQREWEEENYDALGESQMISYEVWIEFLKQKLPE